MAVHTAEVNQIIYQTPAPSSTSWVIIDSQIDDLATLMSFAKQDHQVFLLDKVVDGVEQITQLLQLSESAPDAIHLISHGTPGTLYLGNSELSLSNLADYAEQLKSWSVRDLFIYGCNVAAGDAGEEFLNKLHKLTQANIAAATHRVGNQLLGGNWELNFQLGNTQASSLITPLLAKQYSGVFASIYTVTEDNANNNSNLVNFDVTPDGDFGSGIRVGANGARDVTTDPPIDLGMIQPIDFYFNTDTPQNTGKAFLFLSVFDVDAPDEQDEVIFNGVSLGLLEGQNELDVRTVFELDPSLVRYRAEGVDNLVQIRVNILDSPANWEAEIERAELLINYEEGSTAPGGTALLDVIDTDKPNYEAGESVQFTADLDTTQTPNQALEIETILRDPSGTAVSFIDLPNYVVTGNTPGIDPDTLTQEFTLPNDAVGGTWTIDISVFDQNTGAFQLFDSQPFTVGVVNPSPIPSGPLVFQFKDFVRFEELDENRPYQGPNASFLFEDDFDKQPSVSSETLYLLANPDVAAAVENGSSPSGFEHYQQFGRNEGRNLLPLDYEVGGLRIASLFDETYYLGEYQDVADNLASSNTFVYGYDHFIKFGIQEGRNPSLWYNESFYLANNGDVVDAINQGTFKSGLEHYLNYGHLENRDPSAFFDADVYLSNNPDVAEAVNMGRRDSAFEHYIEYGASEGRIRTSEITGTGLLEGWGTLLFEEAYYLNTNSDVAEAVQDGTYQSGFDHYVLFGQSEGRDPAPFFDESAYLGINPDVDDAVNNSAQSSGMEHYFRFGRQEDRFAFIVGTEVV